MEYLPVIKKGSKETKYLSYESSSLKVYINKKGGFWVTRIWAKDANYQLNKAFVKGKSFKRPSQILADELKSNYKNKIVYGFNASPPIMAGSYYSKVAKKYPIYNLKEPSSLLIKNGSVIIRDSTNYITGDNIYYIDDSNQLTYVPQGALKGKTKEEREKIYQTVIDSGTRNTMEWTPVLVENYKAKKLTKSEEGSNDYHAYRSGMCQVDANNFIVVTTRTSAGKVKRQALADFMGTLGCRIAVNFDGGGSHAAIYKPPKTNTIKVLAGNERSLSSVMYFTELD